MQGGFTGGGRRRLLVHAFAWSLLASGLAGCQTAQTEAPDHTGSIGSSAVLTPSDLTPEQALAAVQEWGGRYSQDQKDKIAALNYAAALRAAGETKQAVAVVRKATIYHPSDREVLAAYGKALASDGQFAEALATVKRAQHDDNPDWQLLATEGGILDSLGEHEKARDRYRQALVLAPGEPQVLNNLGMSYTLTNELENAEETLRQAVASPKATLKIRENLALVLKLRGKGADPAPTPTAAADIAPQQGPTQENTWEELAEEG
jgi:Flp pilus assembly protein TadD